MLHQIMSRIFPHPEWTDAQNSDKELKAVKIQNNTTMFVGEPNMFKTSMLFQASISFSHEEKHVVFICKNVLSKMPHMVHGMPRPDVDVMKSLKILYTSNAEELISYLSSIHTMAVVPDVLVISDLNDYIDQLKAQNDNIQYSISKLCAVIEDTVSFLLKKSEGKFHALLSCSDTNVNHHIIYSRYFPDTFQVSRTAPNLYQCTQLESLKRSQDIKITFTFEEECLIMKEIYIGSKPENTNENEKT